MSFCLTELHLWSLRSSLHVRDTDIGTYQYYDKGEPVTPTDHHYFEEKQHFLETRGHPWTPKNRRPEKLRDTLKELEELLQSSRCVRSKWRNKHFCQMILGSGVLVSLSLSGPQLEKVTIDKTLVGKLAADTISDAVLTDRFMILTFLEKNKVCYIHLTKKQSSPDISKRLEKLSFSELKVSYVDLPGPAGRRLERRVAVNCLQDVAICWWPTVNDDAWPWSPISSERDRANLVLLGCANASLKILSCIRTEWDPLDCCFSITQPYQVLTVEHSLGTHREWMADSCAYECARGRIQRLAVTSIPLTARAISCSRDPTESKLVLGCLDSSLVLYDGHQGVTLLAQATALPSLVEWHPQGALLLVGSSQGELQFFNVALSPIKVQLLAEDLSPTPTLQFSRHLNTPGGLARVQWAAARLPPHGADGLEVHDLLFVSFDGGPIGALRLRLGATNGGQLGPVDMALQCIRYNQVDESINILSGINWNTMGPDSYRCLIAIVDHLLRQKLTVDTEAQLEAALGTFYAPSKPLSDTTVLEYRDAISKYARRFFHHLLRYQRYEKAFLLAVDIGARDLFMDIHYLALDKGELVLAEVAKKKANEIDAESITTGLEQASLLEGETLNEHLPDAPMDRQKVGLPPRGPSAERSLQCQGSPSQDRSRLRPSSQTLSGQLGRELAVEAYTAALMDDPWAWTQAGNNLAETGDQVTGETGSLKVVHFGIV
ncbi:WD repeat-containing and planar cell polarity effector protein fritz homolog isoform X2 [Amia ocellicauda]|uniref:WD repeat-containing and planar cell polarity effector protein fritz homolog isoform X2 n=1 Tax=Amia ocellicauda TaxID=2972642 RepID=UPI0034648537